MIKLLTKFSFQLIIFQLTLFSAHYAVIYFTNISLTTGLLVKSYIINFFLAELIFAIILKLRHSHTDSLGFFFMGGSLFKFAVFFVFFYSEYKLEETGIKAAFLSFFIPYSTCLIIEVRELIKILN